MKRKYDTQSESNYNMADKREMYKYLSKKNLDSANEVEVIGEGLSGTIFKMEYNKYIFARKINDRIFYSKSFEIEDKLIKYKNLDKSSPYKINSDVVEIICSMLLNELIVQQITPNFCCFYGFGFTEYGEIKYDMELVQNHTTLDNFILQNQKIGFKNFMSIIFQILASIYVIQKYFNIVQRDLHTQNILIEQLPEKYNDTYFKYVLNGKEYYIPCFGLRVVMIDFGRSKLKGNSFQPEDFTFDYKSITMFLSEILKNKYYKKSILEFLRVANCDNEDPLHVEEIIQVLFDTNSRDSEVLKYACNEGGYPCFDFSPGNDKNIETYDCDKILDERNISKNLLHVINNGL